MFQMHGDNMNWNKSVGEFFHAGIQNFFPAGKTGFILAHGAVRDF
jgi:hypothetical protein